MDKITQSLHRYLKSEEIPFQTPGGDYADKSTSTLIQFQEEDYVISAIIEIFPSDGHFTIVGFPPYGFHEKLLRDLLSFESKWNRTKKFTTINVMEDPRIDQSNCFTFATRILGVSDPSGLSEHVWSVYIINVLSDTNNAFKQFVSSTSSC